MRALLRPVVAAALLGAAAFASPAGAVAPVCAGTSGTVVVCAAVNPAGIPDVDPEGSAYDDCVYAGPPPCVPVHVPIPTVTPGTGLPVTVTCGGQLVAKLCARVDA
jgi:hypothetical protein